MKAVSKLNNYIAIVLVAFIYLHSLHYFDYIKYDPTIGGWISKLIAILCLLIFFFNKYTVKECPSKYYVMGFLFVPMLSFIPCYFEHGQSFIESFRAYLSLFVLFLYFYLHKKHFTAKTIINILTLFAVVRTIILIVQQFTYPNYLFAFRPEGYDEMGVFHEIEIRSGIYRYYISDSYLSQFLIFYYFQKLTEKYSIKKILLLVIGFIGLYLDQSRQFMATTAGALIFITVLSSKYKHRYSAAIILLILGAILYNYWDVLFGSLAEKTSDEMTKDNIRVVAYYTFFYDFWGGPLSYLFGNGLAGNSEYGIEMGHMMQDLKLFRSDVGIVGFLNQYGIVSVLFFLIFYASFLRKNWRFLDMHLKMFFCATFLNLPLVVFFVNNLNWYAFWAFMMYLLDESIVRNKSKRISLKKKECSISYLKDTYSLRISHI